MTRETKIKIEELLPLTVYPFTFIKLLDIFQTKTEHV